jgi:hypothetical protein
MSVRYNNENKREKKENREMSIVLCILYAYIIIVIIIISITVIDGIQLKGINIEKSMYRYKRSKKNLICQQIFLSIHRSRCDMSARMYE